MKIVRKMKLHEVQTCRCSALVHQPFSICWSDDSMIAMATEKGVCTVGGRGRRPKLIVLALFLSALVGGATATDITSNVFGVLTNMIPAAFGDFNSDEYPDLFVIRGKSIEILKGGDTEPLVKSYSGSNKLMCSFDKTVTSIVPGDFDGDAIMDVLVTLSSPKSGLGCGESDVQEVRVLWGGNDSLKCDSSIGKEPLFMCGQPLALDFNMDMIIDLFGEVHNSRTFWVFNTSRTYSIRRLVGSESLPRLKIPHSHAFLDLNGDYNPDMFVTTTEGYEVWIKRPGEKEGFVFSKNITKFPHLAVQGQSLFLDTELKGKLDHIFPACHNADCTNSSLYVRLNDSWHDLRVNFHDKSNNVWGFVPPVPTSIVQSTVTLHGGDYNMDGYPDLLATLRSGNKMKTFLLKNEQCVADCQSYGRTFTIAWDELAPNNDNTQMGVFYDFFQDGVLDVIFVRNGNVSAFKNNLDYDANFIKVMVITGIKDQKQRVIPDPTGRKNRTYGTNLPGPLVSYNSTSQDDEPRASVSAQLSQSAYMSLHLPYILFGLGRTPNFVDKLTVGVYGKTRDWTQIIPNSQMVVIPIPLSEPSRWMARLFVTPSKLIVKSFVALLGTCLLLTLIIVVLWRKEKREDDQERRQESHRFHYDGM